MAIQDGLETVRVSWTAPPGGGRYRVTADPGGISIETLVSPRILSLQPGVYDIQVETLSQHLPGGTVGPISVSVKGELKFTSYSLSLASYISLCRQHTKYNTIITDCHISQYILDPASIQFHSS